MAIKPAKHFAGKKTFQTHGDAAVNLDKPQLTSWEFTSGRFCQAVG